MSMKEFYHLITEGFAENTLKDWLVMGFNLFWRFAIIVAVIYAVVSRIEMPEGAKIALIAGLGMQGAAMLVTIVCCMLSTLYWRAKVKKRQAQQ